MLDSLIYLAFHYLLLLPLATTLLLVQAADDTCEQVAEVEDDCQSAYS